MTTKDRMIAKWDLFTDALKLPEI